MQKFFYGWYLKNQSDTQTLAIIPAVHQSGRKRTASIQIITNNGVYTAIFPGEAYMRRGSKIYIGRNNFGKNGIRLSIDTPKLKVKGKLRFGTLSPLKYDIMGPFCLLPFMECRHSVKSMKHAVYGKICINGQKYNFQNAQGYWEGDRGISFPKKYVWTQCFYQGGSVMLSVADIPFAKKYFTGIIGVVLWKGREYRLATYLGAKVMHKGNQIIKVVQDDMELEAILLEEKRKPLRAPDGGSMVRIIHESVACRAFYRFKKHGCTVFSFETDMASFEYEY